MARHIDHLVLPVTTLALARSRLTSLGFTVAPDARHPFGTGNCCVFFANRSYLEPITILDRGAADIAAAEGVYFVKRLKRFTERQGEGFAMVAFNSSDVEADLAAYEKADFGVGPVFRFARSATLPDRSEAEVGVMLAFAEDRATPDATFFACQHLAAEALFQTAYLQHPNGAEGVSEIAAVAQSPAEFSEFLSAATGGRAVNVDADNVQISLNGQDVMVLTPAGFRARYGLEPLDPRNSLLLAAIEVAVADLEKSVGFAGPTAIRHEGRIVVPPSPGLGAVLAFRASQHG